MAISLNELARKLGTSPTQISNWRDRGMPLDTLAGAVSWARVNGGRVRWTDPMGKPVPGTTDTPPDNPMAELLQSMPTPRAGVFGVYDRAVIVERLAYEAILRGDTSASAVNAHAKARESLVEAARAAIEMEEKCRRLLPVEAILEAVQRQDGASMSLMDAMPDTLADLLLDQPRKVVVQTLRDWATSYRLKRLETYPFNSAEEKPESFDPEETEAEQS